MMVLRSKLQLSYTSTVLPSGSQEFNFSLTCLVRVFDSLDSSSLSSFEAIVKTKDLPTSALRDYLLTQSNESRSSLSVDDLKTVISSSASVLNAVDCSNAPQSVCDSLNRERCGAVVGTCGECKSGHVGVSGPSNTLCLDLDSASSARHRHLTSQKSNTDIAITRSCNSAADCEVSGLFLECNLQSHVYQSIQQSCPNSCSGHGQCIFISKYDPVERVSECGLMDLDCVSRCDCSEGYVGSSCSIDESELFEVREVRRLLLESVSDMISLENPDVASVKSWVRVLASVATDYWELSDDSKLLLGALCESVLVSALELGLSFEDVSGVEKVIDMSLSMSSEMKTKTNEMVGGENRLLLSSLLNLYNELLLGDMLEGQSSFDVITPLFRTSSFYLSGSASSSFSSVSSSLPRVKLSSPVSALESLSLSQSTSSSNSSASLAVQSITLPPSLSYPLRMSLLETRPTTGISGGGSHRNASELSSVLGGLLYGFPCRRNASSSDCVMRVELVNHNVDVNANLTKSENISFEANCTSGVVEDHEFKCLSGDELIIHCDGSLTGRGRRRCPVTSASANCKSMSVVGSGSGFDLSCELVSFSESSTVCDCAFSFSSKSSPQRRRRSLSEDFQSTSEGGGEGGSVQFSVQSIGKSVMTDFVSTWEVAPTLSVSAVQESVLVLTTMSTIVAAFVMVMLWTVWHDDRERRESENEKSLKLAEDKMLRRYPQRRHRSRSTAYPSLSSQHQSQLSILDESLPSVFTSDSLWLKFKEEVKVYHRWLGIVFYYSPEFPRSMRVLSLFSSIVIMLFVQSVTYNIADPDDGSCEKCEDESCCLSLKSTLNSNEDRCYWSVSANASAVAEGTCAFREIGGDATRVFTVAILSAIISAPFSLLVQYLVTNVLCAPDDLSSASSEDLILPRIRSARSTVGIETNELREACGVSLSSDFKNLLDELSRYCEEIKATPTLEKSIGSLEEFKSSWGMMTDIRVPHQATTSSRILSRLTSRDVTQSTAQHNLLKELSAVRKAVYREYQWFKEGAEKLFVDKAACEEAKRRRLLFLFMKDLTSGVSGEVLSNKSQRDSKSSSSSSRSRNVEGVSLKWKALAWLFVFLMNFGMLFYVFLFAMTQTHSRQSAWFQSFVMWFVFDVFVSSTGVVLVTHLLIPLYVMSDIRTIKRKVLGDIKAFREKQSQSQNQNQNQFKRNQSQNESAAAAHSQQVEDFNSARYLFTSWRVASLFPELPESELILQFRTPWPKKSFKREKKQVTKTYQRRYSFLIQAVSRVLIFFISGLIHFPSVVQDLVIQVGANSGLGYVVLLMLRLYLISPLLPLVPITALGIVIHFLILSNKNSALLERLRLDAATEPEGSPHKQQPETKVPSPKLQSPESHSQDTKMNEALIEKGDDDKEGEEVWYKSRIELEEDEEDEVEEEPQIEWEEDDEDELTSSSEEQKSQSWMKADHSSSSSFGSSL
jgi:hypothetical protein